MFLSNMSNSEPVQLLWWRARLHTHSTCRDVKISLQVAKLLPKRRASKIVTWQLVVTYISCDAAVGLTTAVASDFYNGVLDSSYHTQTPWDFQNIYFRKMANSSLSSLGAKVVVTSCSDENHPPENLMDGWVLVVCNEWSFVAGLTSVSTAGRRKPSGCRPAYSRKSSSSASPNPRIFLLWQWRATMVGELSIPPSSLLALAISKVILYSKTHKTKLHITLSYELWSQTGNVAGIA